MSMFRTAALAALALSPLAFAPQAFANENDSPTGSPLAYEMQVSRGTLGTGRAGTSPAYAETALAQPRAVTQTSLSGFAQSLAGTNNATSSDIGTFVTGSRMAAVQ